MKLIDADALEKAIYEWMPKDQETWMDSKIPPIENLVVSIMMTIQEQPTVEAEPVRHGKWTKIPSADIGTCSCCGDKWGSVSVMNYCPNCGAKMDAERKEE